MNDVQADKLLASLTRIENLLSRILAAQGPVFPIGPVYAPTQAFPPSPTQAFPPLTSLPHGPGVVWPHEAQVPGTAHDPLDGQTVVVPNGAQVPPHLVMSPMARMEGHNV